MDAATESKPTYEQHRGSARSARDGPAERDQPHRQREPHVTAGTGTAELGHPLPGRRRRAARPGGPSRVATARAWAAARVPLASQIPRHGVDEGFRVGGMV